MRSPSTGWLPVVNNSIHLFDVSRLHNLSNRTLTTLPDIAMDQLSPTPEPGPGYQKAISPIEEVKPNKKKKKDQMPNSQKRACYLQQLSAMTVSLEATAALPELSHKQLLKRNNQVEEIARIKMRLEKLDKKSGQARLQDISLQQRIAANAPSFASPPTTSLSVRTATTNVISRANLDSRGQVSHINSEVRNINNVQSIPNPPKATPDQSRAARATSSRIAAQAIASRIVADAKASQRSIQPRNQNQLPSPPKISQTPLKSREKAKEQPVPVYTAPVQAPSSSIRPVGRQRDPVVQPSQGSGGVPQPSLAYLSRTNFKPVVLSSPRHILLVIDLNGTILHRPDKNRSAHFIERPNTQHFLQYVLANFNVMIWSSAKPENVNKMCSQLFPGPSQDRLVAKWARDRLGLTPSDYSKRVQCYKRLSIIWNDREIQQRHPEAAWGRFWNQGNTVLLDDSLEKARSEPHNLVQVPEFSGRPEDPNILGDLAQYLTILKVQADVSAFIRQSPFKASVGSLSGSAALPARVGS
jgi:hypothetical protein